MRAQPTIDVLTRDELLSAGYTSSGLTAAVRSGQLIRARRDHYLLPGTPDSIITAVRVGGRLGCTSVLATAGIWVDSTTRVHVHLDSETSRPRSPRSRRQPLTVGNRDGAVLHWRRLVQPEEAIRHSVGLVDAMIQTLCCCSERFALASLDSALRGGMLNRDQLDVIFFHVPRRLRHLRELIDARSESGLESLFRYLLIDAGLPFEIQVQIGEVGRVDFVVGGSVVVETDGINFHGAATAERDYDRDLELAARGYLVLRISYRQVMFQPEKVLRAVLAAVRSHSSAS